MTQKEKPLFSELCARLPYGVVVNAQYKDGEEDVEMIDLLISILEINHPNEYFKSTDKGDVSMRAVPTKKITNWLKSLRSQKHMKYIDAEKLKNEIDKRIKELEPVHPHFKPFVTGQKSAFKDCLNLIDSLQSETNKR